MNATLFRAWIYEYLSQLFDGDVEHLPEPPDGAVDPCSWSAAVGAIRQALAESSSETVSADYARLFVNAPGGVAAPPYASWYLDGRLRGPSCDFAEQAYAAQGLESTPDAGEPPDYVGAELEFMYFLARHEFAARTTGDDEALGSVLVGEAEFVLRHLARWLPAFVARIRAADSGPVFNTAADLLWAVVQDDVRRLSTWQSKAIASGRTG